MESNHKFHGPGILGVFEAGQRFHDYTLREYCGCSAYGEVWRTEDVSGRRLAVKIVSKAIYGSGWPLVFESIKRYCRAIDVHPNLIQIMHIGEDDHYFFYTMELADNMAEAGFPYYADTLAARMAVNGALPPKQLLMLAKHVLNGISLLHGLGLIHRNIKPSNIIFIKGMPKLSDIGFAGNSSLAGTAGFTPPEELRGSKDQAAGNTGQCDLYALGKVIYCALSGQSPDKFPYIPEAINFSLRKRLNHVAGLACCKNPSDRISSVGEFRKMLALITVSNDDESGEQRNNVPSAAVPERSMLKKLTASAITVIAIAAAVVAVFSVILFSSLLKKNWKDRPFLQNLSSIISDDEAAAPVDTGSRSSPPPAVEQHPAPPALQADKPQAAPPAASPPSAAAANSSQPAVPSPAAAVNSADVRPSRPGVKTSGSLIKRKTGSYIETQNPAETIKAAEQGDAEAQFKLGLYYCNVEKNRTAGMKWIRQAAEQGHSKAQFSMGSGYYFSPGPEKNYVEALAWYRKAAEQENMLAQFALGFCYINRKGVERDQAEAEKWFRRAAAQGFTMAQMQSALAAFCAEDKNTMSTRSEILNWWTKAVPQNNAQPAARQQR